MAKLTLLHASAHDLRDVRDGSVQAIVTSPPYFGLRTYEGVSDIEWPRVAYDAQSGVYHETVVQHWCGVLGNETTPAAYVGHLVLCLREWQRVLADDGVIWLNLGDAYNGSGGAGGDYNRGGLREGQAKYGPRRLEELKPKDLVGIPYRVALAAQADGWYLRSPIIWHKPNSRLNWGRDRVALDHEYVWMLAKSERYYFDRSIDFGTVWSINTQGFPPHRAVFPEELVRRALTLSTREGDTVLDPFVGSGTTCKVALIMGRNVIGADMSHRYLSEVVPLRLGALAHLVDQVREAA